MPQQNVKIHNLRENEVANPSVDQFILFDKAIREGEGGNNRCENCNEGVGGLWPKVMTFHPKIYNLPEKATICPQFLNMSMYALFDDSHELHSRTIVVESTTVPGLGMGGLEVLELILAMPIFSLQLLPHSSSSEGL